MSKKILIVTECFFPEEFKINEVALFWQEKGYEIDVLTMVPTYPESEVYAGYKNRWYQRDIYQGITVHRIKAVTGYKSSLLKKFLKYFTFMFLGSIVSLFIGRKYDFVFGFSMSALTGMVPAVLLKTFYNKPVTLWVQDIWPDSVYAYGFRQTKLLKFFLDGFVRFVYHNTEAFAISAKGFKNKIQPYLTREKKILYLPNWADDLNRNLKGFQFSIEPKVQFLFAGNIGKVQNLSNIILAFSRLPQDILKKAQLNFIGDGSHLDFLQNLVKTNNVENIIFWGRKPRQDMYQYFFASDFLIVSLIDQEIFSLTVPAKIQTYIAANKPILAIIKGEAAHIVTEYNLGYTASPNNIDEIINIFTNAIKSSIEERNKFIENGEYLTSTMFNKVHILDTLLELTTQSFYTKEID